jgi:hypothetical protein
MSEQEVVSAGSANLVPVDQTVAPSAAPIESRQPRAADPSPLISDEEQFMVESFVTGFGSCPEEYREVFYEAWARCHPESRHLLFTAWLAVDVFEKVQTARHASPAQERA